ncbi:MAG: hypothetical protein RLZZ587_305 [Actinomycetota bacterium]|jgi:uncharacterized protein with FMN-binding domain
MATMGVLATGIAWGAGGFDQTTTPTDSAAATDNGSGANSGGTDPSPSATPTDSSSASTAHDGTYDGDTVQTRYGPMQIEVVIANGKIESAIALQHPGGDRESEQINAQVIPMLNDAIVQYQSLNFGNVSRATISTNGYKQSAQSALDQAGFTG